MTLNYSEYYDDIYKDSEKYKKHYLESPYFPIWEQALTYIKGSVFEIGCGTGQFANLLRDRTDIPYLGVDFSTEAIRIAKEVNPDMKFTCADVIGFGSIFYDTIVAFEVMEHIENDKEILNMIHKDQRFIFSVPNYMSKSHYRCFKSKEDIKEYYDLDIKTIDEFSIIYNRLGAINKIFLVYAEG